MGLNADSGTFAKDVLKVEITGPNQPNITLVDLPGLIQVGEENQSDADVGVVSSLVQEYIENPRSIILCVVSAKSDYANQVITARARDADPERLRTLGIVTKPDKLDQDSEMEKEYADLLRTESARGFRLGWHALRNRDFQSKNCSDEERDKNEAKFFGKGVWANLSRNRVGIASLRSRLSAVLTDQIGLHLPLMTEEIKSGVRECRDALAKLGPTRSTSREQRLYLLQISQDFGRLVKEAVDGTYNDPFFENALTKSGYTKHIRALVQNTSRDFSDEMHRKGHQRNIVEHHSHNTRGTITRAAFLQEVQTLMRRSRGRELPGTFNPLIISDLFFQQSKPWGMLVEKYCRSIMDEIRSCLELVLASLTNRITYDALARQFLNPGLEKLAVAVNEKADEVLRPHQTGHPITYNHYFTDVVQKSRQEHQQQELKKALHRQFSIEIDQDAFEIPRILSTSLLNALTVKTEQDMDIYACSELTYCMEAYYKVAMKTLIDNIAALAVETCLLEKLPTLLSAETFMSIEENELSIIAGESKDAQDHRAATITKLESLKSGLLILRRLDYYRRRGPSRNGDRSDESSDYDWTLGDRQDEYGLEPDESGETQFSTNDLGPLSGSTLLSPPSSQDHQNWVSDDVPHPNLPKKKGKGRKL